MSKVDLVISKKKKSGIAFGPIQHNKLKLYYFILSHSLSTFGPSPLKLSIYYYVPYHTTRFLFSPYNKSLAKISKKSFKNN